MFWHFIHMLVQDGSVFDMCVFIMGGLETSHFLSIILCVINIDHDLKILKHWSLLVDGLFFGGWIYVGNWVGSVGRVCFTWSVEQEVIVSCIVIGSKPVIGGCLCFSMPNVVIYLSFWTSSSGISFIVNFFALVCLFPISKRFFTKSRLLPI